jgi:hypothetical protein
VWPSVSAFQGPRIRLILCTWTINFHHCSTRLTLHHAAELECKQAVPYLTVHSDLALAGGLASASVASSCSRPPGFERSVSLNKAGDNLSLVCCYSAFCRFRSMILIDLVVKNLRRRRVVLPNALSEFGQRWHEPVLSLSSCLFLSMDQKEVHWSYEDEDKQTRMAKQMYHSNLKMNSDNCISSSAACHLPSLSMPVSLSLSLYLLQIEREARVLLLGPARLTNICPDYARPNSG